MPDWVHKNTKKYMTKDFVSIDLVKGNTQKTNANVEVRIFDLSLHLISFSPSIWLSFRPIKIVLV